MAKKHSPTDLKLSVIKRIQRTEAYAEKVRQLFAQTVNEILSLNKSVPTLDEGVMFSFDGESRKMQTKVETLLRRLHSVATMAIESGIKLEWEEANKECDTLVASCFGKKVLSSPEFSAWVQRNEGARDAFISRTEKGLNLSQRVWNSVKQLREEMEVAMTVAIGEGESAASMSRKVRQYLNDPDLMFRRFRYKIGENEEGQPVYGKKWKKRVRDEKTGKYKWIDYDRDSYKTGAGVYKSSAKNAMRVTRNETNIAYRRSDAERWQQMDFVLGQRIQLSKNHPKKDICDKLQGDYPTDFVFDGWHVQCFCFSTPILVDESEMAKVTEAFLRGEKYIPQGKKITTYPDAFKSWVKDHAEQIADVRSRGTEPYFIRNNSAVIDEMLNPTEKPLTIAEKAAIRHAARTPEQIEAIQNRWNERKKKHELIKKTANNVLKVAQDYGEVDYSLLQKYIDAGDLSGMQTVVKVVAAQISTMKKEEKALSALIPDAHKWHKTFTLAELQKVYDSVEAKLAKFSGLTLEEQKKQLAKEIKYVEDPTYLKPHTQYPTWKVSQAAYMKQLDAVNYKIAIKPIIADLEIVKKWSDAHPKSLNVAKFLADAQAAVANGDDIVIIQQKAQLAVNEHQKRLAEQARRDAKKGAVVFSEMNKKTIDKLLKDYDNNTVDAMDDSLRPLTEAVWATLTDEEKVVLTKYTQSYSYLNERLRGLSYYGGRTQKEYDHDMPILTSVLNKFKTTKDMVVRRGTGTYYIPELGKDLSGVSVGDTFTDGAFLSTACHRRKGFTGDLNMIILVPKGARGAFAEPFSHYTDSFKFDYNGTLWDGKSKETIEQEFEWIGQRGSRFKVIKVDGRNIYLQMIGQLR